MRVLNLNGRRPQRNRENNYRGPSHQHRPHAKLDLLVAVYMVHAPLYCRGNDSIADGPLEFATSSHRVFCLASIRGQVQWGPSSPALQPGSRTLQPER
jgi:hypothetical protein